jgi:hypothetical protein
VSSAKAAEPLSDLSDDFVDSEWLQNGRFLFQLRTPYLQNLILAPFILLVIAFINNLLDCRFPFLKMHRLFLFDFGIARYPFATVSVFRAKSNVRQQYQLATEAYGRHGSAIVWLVSLSGRSSSPY